MTSLARSTSALLLRQATRVPAAGPSTPLRLRAGLILATRTQSPFRSTPIAPLDRSRRWNSSTSTTAAEDGSLRIDAPAEGSKVGSHQIGKIEPRLSLTFTCTADDCGHRSTHEFSKRSYTKGIVLVQCPSCKNRHLIADNLGWFKESLDDGKMKNIEDLLRAKGEKIRKGRVGFDGDIEYDPEE